MKTYSQFYNWVKKNNIDENTPILLGHRESSLSKITYLNLVVKGNSFTATDEKRENDQYHIDTVGDLTSQIAKSLDNAENRIANFIISKVNSTMNITLRLGKRHSTGYVINNFEIVEEKVILDLSINSNNNRMDFTRLT